MTPVSGTLGAGWVRAALTLAIVIRLSAQVCAAGPFISCHIHPPEPSPGAETPATTIGPFSAPADCEAARASLFGELGRCHCTTGFGTGRATRGDRAQGPGSGTAPTAAGPERGGALP